MVPSMAQEAIGHEGCEEGDVPVGLLHLHLPQLHLDGLQETRGQGSPLSPLPSPLRSSPFSISELESLSCQDTANTSLPGCHRKHLSLGPTGALWRCPGTALELCSNTGYRVHHVSVLTSILSFLPAYHSVIKTMLTLSALSTLFHRKHPFLHSSI